MTKGTSRGCKKCLSAAYTKRRTASLGVLLNPILGEPILSLFCYPSNAPLYVSIIAFSIVFFPYSTWTHQKRHATHFWVAPHQLRTAALYLTDTHVHGYTVHFMHNTQTHTHIFCALSSTSAFALQKPHAVQCCMAFSWPHHRQCGLGETEREEKDMWAQNTYRLEKQSKKEHRKRERCRESVDRCSESLSGPPSDTVSDDDKWKTTVIKHNQTHREKITLRASLKYVIVL